MPKNKGPRISLGSVLILHALARGSRYGFDILEDTGLTSGTVYPALEKLERDGFARSKWEDARVARQEKRPPRRYYELTPRGAEVLAQAIERHRALSAVDLSTFGQEVQGAQGEQR